jgi:hypothetical protein
MAETTPAPALPDVVLNPDAVLGDSEANWRHGRAPDYSKTRKFYAEGTTLSPSQPPMSPRPHIANTPLLTQGSA